ncbi:MAG: 5-methyltetrahydropteroyltriglutamate--homocysteine S-methyltransferase [Pseudomonadales bacterium]|jgi:5-methyltetrahydropteroyltriglutamate--homocysteine methyltransferase|nr:5-methyltetrahydropteroyltriglutamate--homocysteine S-methyltransferase [Pseudomonadales bacterium]
MSTPTPPFRADQVGSLLRPRYLLDAREQFATGKIDAAVLREVENRAIAEAVKKQEAIGLPSISDGEFRRSYFHLDFFRHLDGVTIEGNINASSSVQNSAGFSPPKLSVTGKLRHQYPISLGDYQFLQAQTPAKVKITMPSPTMLHFRGGRAGIDAKAYPDLEEFFSDLAQAYRDEIETLYQAGCRNIQLDDTNLAYLCDPKMRADAAARGEDPNTLPALYARIINAAIEHKHQDLTIGIHLCRGNFKSGWFASGGYEPVADVLFNSLNVNSYYLEFDDERSGDFSPLRFVPASKFVVLGLVSSKIGALETRDSIIARLEEAANYMPKNNMGLSPQCGFSSTSHGNNLTEEQQWNKLRFVVDVAKEVWGTAGSAR